MTSDQKSTTPTPAARLTPEGEALLSRWAGHRFWRRDQPAPADRLTLGEIAELVRCALAEIDALRADPATIIQERDAEQAKYERLRVAAVTARYVLAHREKTGNLPSTEARADHALNLLTTALAAESQPPDMASLTCCRAWAWAPEMGPYSGAHHPRCPALEAAEKLAADVHQTGASDGS